MPKKKSIDKKSAETAAKSPAEGAGDAVRNGPEKRDFPVIGLGASAGGLKALKAFFSNVPEKTGMAYIVVAHMSPDQPSMMPELLGTVARIPVSTAEDGRVLEPDHAYVVPPNKEISVFKGTLQLLAVAGKGASLPIDSFLKSLALDRGERAAAVILSGTGMDGTLGVKEIKANVGLVVAQSEGSADYDGMPRSAIGTGLVDMVLPPEEMPEKIAQYFMHRGAAVDHGFVAGKDRGNWLHKIFGVLRSRTGHDFSAYKKNTLLRRISRRMSLNHIEDHETYIRFMREDPNEAEALFREMLIGVTSFFRDPESFDALKTDILPDLLEKMKDGDTFRAWIPGCSTGEEVYSLAMVLRECLDKTAKRINLQLFGTDIDRYAIEKAREGLFPASIAGDVDSNRLSRFFTKEGDFFRIRKDIRDVAVFSVQDILKDPPFSRLNLLCCRNLLIYLDGEAQKKVLPLFHYTLSPNGVLVLGSSETIGGFTSLFRTLDKHWKIFQKQEVSLDLRAQVQFPSGQPSIEKYEIIARAPGEPKDDIGRMTRKAVLDGFSPTAILIDAQGHILHVQGRTGKYLENVSGPPTQNILNLARDGLRIELSSAIRAAVASNQKVTRKNIEVKTNGDKQMVHLHVCPQHAPKELEGRFLVVFEDLPGGGDPGPAISSSDADDSGESTRYSDRIAELERELQSTRESHQTTVEELESSNEELKATNEELQSSNEELQSTNEEMESSREELQSLNEELHTVNAELQSKLEELSAAHDDMRNLLENTEIATIFVDNDMQVRRFTQEATDIVNLIPTDIGRPLKHVMANLKYEGMIADLTDVLKKLTPKKIEVRTTGGGWFNMRIAPYRTTDNRIDGAVLTFASIDEQKRTEQALKTANVEMTLAWELTRDVFDLNSEPLAVLDGELAVVIANKAFCELADLSPEKARGFELKHLHVGSSDKTDFMSELKNALDTGESFETRAFQMETPDGERTFSIEGRVVRQTEAPHRVLLRFLQRG